MRPRVKSRIGLVVATLIAVAAAACGSEPAAAPAPEPQAPTPTATSAPAPEPTVSATTPEAPAPIVAASPSSAKVASDVESFVLEELVVAVGTEVTWTNRDTSSHTITSGSRGSSTGIWDSPVLAKGVSYSFIFNEVGTFEYFCRIHPTSMNSTITVVPIEALASAQASAEPSPTSEPTATPMPPTATTVPPTAKSVPPTATTEPSTATAVPPTQTPVPPTPTAKPTATATALAVVEQSVTLTPIKDNTLYEDSEGALSNGSGVHLFAGKTDGGLIRRAILAFDLAGQIPAGATIRDAALTLHMSKTSAGPQTVEVRKLLAGWGEGGSDAAVEEGRGIAPASGDATWIHTELDSGLWQTPGGDFSGTVSAKASVAGSGDYAWGPGNDQMVADVQSWLDDPSSNFGWIVIGNESINRTTKRFDSREHATAANRPRLEVTFAAPEGSTSSRNGEPSATADTELGY